MMNDLVQNTPVVLLVITLLIYAISLRLYQSSHKSILLLPVVTGITLVVVLLTFLDILKASKLFTFYSAQQPLHWRSP
jgi:putative effector of murein hydrolase